MTYAFASDPRPENTETIVPSRRAGLYRSRAKRWIDVALVTLSLPVVLPLILLLALLISSRDGGPALYSQPRVGRGGRIFRCWKLRTMVIDADARLAGVLAADPGARAEWTVSQKLCCDPRITAVGRFLRRSSLDELPQLWNVLRGEMSLVGPRPMTPEQQPIYPGRCYYEMRPGLTGFWQISDRHRSSFADRAQFDSDYARAVSLRTDIEVLAVTVRVVLRGTGC